MSVIRGLTCECIKLKRTPASVVLLAVPIIFPILLLGYLKLSGGDSVAFSHAFEVFFQLESIGLPVILGLLAGLMGEQEREAGSLQNLKTYQAPSRSFLLKCLFLGGVTLICIFLSIAVFSVGRALFLKVPSFDCRILFLAGALMFLGALFLLPLSLFLGLVYGQGPSIGAGAGGLLIAALIGTTTAGEKFWYLIPWSWPARLSWSAILLDSRLKLFQTLDAGKVFAEYMVRGLVPAIITGAVLLIISAKLFEKKLLRGLN